jgi:hypothetical protein
MRKNGEGDTVRIYNGEIVSRGIQGDLGKRSARL